MREIIKQLVSIRQELFKEALNHAMDNELKEINDVFEDGDEYIFELKHLDNSKDINLQLLVDLIKHVEKTTDSLAKQNKINLGEFLI